MAPGRLCTQVFCPAEIHIENGVHSSAYGAGIANTTVDILGTFVVDNDFQFSNCTVYMEPGAQVVVQSGRIYALDHSTEESCSGRIWRTITANEGSFVSIYACTVRDAENVVTALDGSTVKLTGNEFIDDRNTVYVPASQDPAIFSNVALVMTGNQFTSSGTMAQPYPGQTTPVGAVGYAAVDADQTVYLDMTGGDNMIDGMSNGIVGHRSNMAVSGFVIRNVQPDPAYAYTGNGAAIFARGDHGYFTLKQQGYGQYGAVNFENCQWGVYTEYMNVHSTDNNMQNVVTGYRIDFSGNRSVDLLYNTVAAYQNGMELRMNDGAEHFLVQGNRIIVGFYDYGIGILVSEGLGANPDSKILNNLFHVYPEAYAGIELQAADKWLVAGNTLSMYNNAFNRYGIVTSGSTDFEVSCNQITGAGSTFPNINQAAIKSNMGGYGLFSCNVMGQTANGMLFNGYAYGTEMRGNQFHLHKWGLHLGPTAIIGPQNLKGNLWYEEPAAGGWGALNENPNDIYLYQFTYNPAIINLGNTEPPSWSPTNWFQTLSGDNYDCGNDQGVNYCSQFNYVWNVEGINALDQQIAQDSLRNDPYTAETQWMLEGGLYQKLDDNPGLRDSLPDMAAFYNDLQGSATAAFKAVDDDQLALYDMDSTVNAQLQSNRAQIESYMALVKTGMEGLDDSTLTAAQTDSIIAGLSGYRQNINTLVAWNNTALEVARTSKSLTADGIKAANANIGTSKLIEENEKQVNEIYLSVIAKEVDTFSVGQANTLYSISNQCPMMGGNAVYKARSMYRLINDTIVFDDQLLCLPHGIIIKSVRQQEANSVGVVPNPARDQATLVLGQPLEEAGSFAVYDAVGKEVMRLQVPSDVNRVPFNTGNLATGMYHYRVTNSSGLVGQSKWSIFR